MKQAVSESKTAVSSWVLIVVSSFVVVLAMLGGAAYAAGRKAGLQAAQANISRIALALTNAEQAAVHAGFVQPAGSYSHWLRSYTVAEAAELSDFEQAVLADMFAQFGDERSFDFAVTKYENNAGGILHIYYFPVAGRTDVRYDHYYTANGNLVTEVNG